MNTYSTPTILGAEIVRTYPVVFVANSFSSATLKTALGGLKAIFGDASASATELQIEQMYEQTLRAIETKAQRVGADALVSFTISLVVADGNTFIMTAMGTPVSVSK